MEIEILIRVINPEEARANRRPTVHQPWFGDSVGWYENGELVVESVNINLSANEPKLRAHHQKRPH